jgi:hypothetical protein
VTAKDYSPQPLDGPFAEQTWDYESPDLVWLLDYWNSLRGDLPCPAWSAFDLLSIHKRARFMTVKDATDDGEDFLVRFWGTGLVSVLEYDGTGKRMSEYFPDINASNMLESHQLALRGDVPVRRWGVSQFPNQDYTTFEMIHLPLINDVGERAHVITLTAFKAIEG